MSATCGDCGRIVPPEETREGPYVDGAGHWHCLACIVDVEAQVERWWPVLKDTLPTEADLKREAFLRYLGIQP